MTGTSAAAKLDRTTFRTSRLLDFASTKELTAQTGHPPEDWPLVVLKELVDNALDACEEAGIAPEITVRVGAHGITVSDNGPGLPAKVVEDVLDFSVRVSSREAYVSPSRGAQGNALKTLVAMPFVLDGKTGRVEVDAQRRSPQDHLCRRSDPPAAGHPTRAPRRTCKNRHPRDGALAAVQLAQCCTTRRTAFYKSLDDFVWLNPHLTLAWKWFGETDKGRGDRSVVAEVAAVRSDVGALVPARSTWSA